MTQDLSRLNVDAVLCINLKSREDRRVALQEVFKDSGLNIEFFRVDKDCQDPQRGCWNSHQACARLALDRKYKRVLILEDDCVLQPFSSTTVDRINRFLEEKTPEIFYLGVLLGKLWLTWRRNIARCRGKGTHAYILSEEGCRRVIGLGDYAKMGIDSAYTKEFKAMYCVFPMICFQNDNLASDIQLLRDEINKAEIGGGGSSSCVSPHANDKRKQYIVVMKNLHKTLFFR